MTSINRAVTILPEPRRKRPLNRFCDTAGSDSMATYMMLTSFTDKGERSVSGYAETIREIAKEIDYRGAKIITQYALLGPYDFVMIVEAPGDEVVAKLAIHLRAIGPLQTTTFAAIPMDSLIATLQEKPRNF